MIPIIVAQRKAYVWDVNDIRTLRTEYQICGILSGTLPHLSQQNVFLGVPLVLMPEEVIYLVGKRIAVLVDDARFYFTPSPIELRHWTSEQETLSRQLSSTQSKGTTSGYPMSEEALRKRREREERRLKAKENTESLVIASQENMANENAAPTSLQTVSQDQNLSLTHTLTIPASSRNLDWYRPSSQDGVFVSIDSAKAAGIWDFPTSPHERARCGIFRDLRDKGYFIGGGIKFGGEYLVYPGDPLRYHSHFVATVLESPISKLHPMEVVAHGRLGTATKKMHLLCGWDDEQGKASYLSIEWAGFG